jgi:hypothetical protein
MVNKAKPVLMLALYAVIIGILVGFLELIIGHRFILDPLLYHSDTGFVYETYFAPTYYGLSKTIVIGLTFFFTFLATKKSKLKQITKSVIVGIIGTAVFGLYYYITFPQVGSSSSTIIGLVHFSFIAGITYGVVKFFNIK